MKIFKDFSIHELRNMVVIMRKAASLLFAMIAISPVIASATSPAVPAGLCSTNAAGQTVCSSNGTPLSTSANNNSPACSSTTGSSNTPTDCSNGYCAKTLLDDMRLNADYQYQYNAAQSGFSLQNNGNKGYITQGLMRGDALASWWNDSVKYPFLFNPTNITTSATMWPVLGPWFVIFAGVGNDDGNTRVEMKNDEVFVLHKSTMKWVAIRPAQDPIWASTYFSTEVNTRIEADGHPSYLVPGGANIAIHGGSAGYIESNPSDIIAIHHRFQARLVVNDTSKPLNASNTRRLIQTSVDLKQQVQPMQYNPGAGSSRLKAVTPSWQLFTFTTVLPDGMTNANPPINRSLKVYLTESEMLANLPPGISCGP